MSSTKCSAESASLRRGITRRAFLSLGGLGGLSVFSPWRPAWVRAVTQTNVRQTLEAVIRVLLPGGGAHGTRNDESGALDSRLYDQAIYDHLRGEYFLSAVDQAALDQAASQLDFASLCLGFLTRGFANTMDQKQAGLLASVTRRVDEGEAPYLTPLETICLRLVGAEGRGQQLVDLARFAGLIYYPSDQGSSWLKQAGYPGANWGFDPGNGWGPIQPPMMEP